MYAFALPLVIPGMAAWHMACPDLAHALPRLARPFSNPPATHPVMAGLVPAIHVLPRKK
jgi:hypothetical protein